MRIVFDTNIYLASLKEGSLSFRLLETILGEENDFFLYTSPDLKSELFEKLESWKKKKLVSGAQISRLKFLLDNFIHEAIPQKKINEVAADPDDNKVLECAIEARAHLIVSMDRHLLRLKAYQGIAIVHPKTFSWMTPKE